MKSAIITKLKNKKIMFSLFVLFVVGGVFVTALTVQAADLSVQGLVNGLIGLIARLLLYLAQLCIRASLFFWEYFIELAAYNNFINAPPVTIGWVMIRDLANMFFIVALMVIAVGTVLGIEQYEWKKSLVKLIFAAIFINFSKLILQLVLDFAQILMDTFLIAFKGQSGNHLIKMFSLGKMTELLRDTSDTGEGYNYQLFVGAVVALVMAMLVMLTILSYLVVMVGRMIVLWMLMILSPLAFVLSAFPFGKQYASEFWKNFFNYAMVGPIMVFFTWLAFASLQTGSIVSDINIQVSKLSQAGGSIGGGGDSISINQASTWENLASFFIAIGFFVVGITMVQRMGVVGGQLTSKALDFTKKVATIASGYAAGRWLVGAATSRGGGAISELGGDYGKLAWGATGGRLRHAPGVRNIPLIGAAGGARRKAAVKRLEDIEIARTTQYSKEGPRGLARILAPEKAEVAEEEFKASEATRISEVSMDRLRAQATKKYFEGDLPKFYENKAGLIQARLGVDIKTEYAKDYAAVQKAIDAKDYNEAEGAMRQIEKNLSERFDGDPTKSYGPAERRDLDRKAAEGTYMTRRALEEAYLEEAKGDEEERRSWINGVYNHSYLKEEDEVAMKRIVVAHNDLINNKMDEVKGNPELVNTVYEQYKSAMKKAGGDFVVEELRNSEDWKNMTSAQRKVKEEAVRKEAEENIEKEDQDKLRDRAIRQHAIDSLTEKDKRTYYKQAGVYDGLAKIGGDYFLYESQNRVRKHKTELEGWQKRSMDYARAIEGKSTDNREEWEKTAARKDLDEIIRSLDTYEQKSEKVDKTGADIIKLKQKQRELKKNGQKLSPEDKKALDSAVQQQARYFSAFLQEHGGSFAGKVGELDSSYKTVEVTNRANVGRVIAGVLTGRSWNEVESEEDFQEAEAELRARFKEKDSRLFRMIEMAMNKAADKGQTSFYRQVSQGMDESGEKVFGFSSNFIEGAGTVVNKKRILGTGKIGQDGRKWQQTEEQVMLHSALDANTVKDKRFLHIRDGSGKARAYQSDAALEAMLSQAYLNPIQVMDKAKLTQTDVNALSGGDFVRSAFDASRGIFEFQTEEIRKSLAVFFQRQVENIRKLKAGSLQQQNALLALRAWLNRFNIKEVDGEDVFKVDRNKIINFLNDKLIAPKVGSESPVVKDKSAVVSQKVEAYFREIGNKLEELSDVELTLDKKNKKEEEAEQDEVEE